MPGDQERLTLACFLASAALAGGNGSPSDSATVSKLRSGVLC